MKIDRYHFDIILDNGERISDTQDAIGREEKGTALRYLLTGGLGLNENTVLQTVYPTHRIDKILITNITEIERQKKEKT